MPRDQFKLLTQRRFLPYFITQLLGSFNDNAFKMAALTLIAFHLVSQVQQVQYYQALGAAFFTVPFFLFSATAGQLADKYNKALLIRIIKFFEVLFMIIGGLSLLINDIPLMLTTIFLMGTHSAFFGPLKYSILPDQLQDDELIAGNALVEAGTFTAILLGTILGALLIPSHKTYLSQGLLIIAILVFTIAASGVISSFYIPSTYPAAPKLKLNINFLTATLKIIIQAKQNKVIYKSILGISWFWLIGTVFLTELPGYVKYNFAADNTIFSLFLAIFTIGVASGSLIVNTLLQSKITTKLVPSSLFIMSIFIFDLFIQTPSATPNPGELSGISKFLYVANHWHILLDLFFIAVSAGLYVVPLYALIQHLSAVKSRSQIIAANNIINAIFMVISSLIILCLSYVHIISIPFILLLVAILNIPAALFMARS